MTNGSNHWILRQPDQVSKTETMTVSTWQWFSVLLTWSGLGVISSDYCHLSHKIKLLIFDDLCIIG